MRWVSRRPESSKRHNSTFSACSENKAKFTPSPSQVAPSGYGLPGQTIAGVCLVNLPSFITELEDTSRPQAGSSPQKRGSLSFHGTQRECPLECLRLGFGCDTAVTSRSFSVILTRKIQS